MTPTTPPGAGRGEHEAGPAPGDWVLLWVFCLACFTATVSLFGYMQVSMVPELEQLSDHPEPLTALFGLCAAATLLILFGTRGRPAFSSGLRTALVGGAIAATLGFSAYVTYVYGLSTALAVAEAAPKVGDMAPEIRVTDPDGRTFDLADYRGGPALVVFYRGQW